MAVFLGNKQVTNIYKGNKPLVEGLRGVGSFFTPPGQGGGVFRSAAEILAANPSATSGIYSIQPDPNKPAFDAYCDMETDGGGWTLVLSGGDVEIDYDSTFWDGTGDSNINYPFSGSTFNTSDSETILGSLEFTELRAKWGDQVETHVSNATSTFAQKKAAGTTWQQGSGGYTFSWNLTDRDGYSYGNFLLGYRGAVAGYGDYNYFYIGGNPYGYTTFGHQFIYQNSNDTCGLSNWCRDPNYSRGHTIARTGHRFSYQYDKNELWFR